MKPDKAFILAAGYGKRLRPITESLPKPLVEVAGQSLLERTVDQLNASGIKEVVINTHYLAEKIQVALKDRQLPKIIFSHEKELLDTGGGIKNALHYFQGEPFFVLSGDGLWEDDPKNAALEYLAQSWDPQKMDILVLLQPVQSMKLTQGAGDYDLDQDHRAIRSFDKTGQYMFTSMRIHHPRIFEDTPQGAFSYLELLDHAQAKGRLYGIVHSGDWHHISTPQDLARADEYFKARQR